MKKLISGKGRHMKQKPPYLRIVLTLIASVALVVVVLLNVFTHIFSVVQYYGDSMEPRLHDRQILLVLKTQKVKPGDVVAFYYNNKILVRRVICGSGTSIEIDEHGQVTVDGTALDEPYLSQRALGQSNISYPFTVPHKEFFVMGDNREISMDSRLEEIGTIPADRIIGKVILDFG